MMMHWIFLLSLDCFLLSSLPWSSHGFQQVQPLIITTKLSHPLPPSRIAGWSATTTRSRHFAQKEDNNENDKDVANDGMTKQRPRRKRKVNLLDKDESQTVPSSTTSSTTPTRTPITSEKPPKATNPIFSPRSDTPIELNVLNVREIMNQSPTGPTAVAAPKTSSSTFPKTESFTPTPTNNNVKKPETALKDSLEMLLEDAKRMQQEEQEKQQELQSTELKSQMFSNDYVEDTTTIQQKIGNVLSTIVTIDFFVVCGFLVWFLVGIVSSYIFKDDTIQIAFNSNFEAFVQPALGILMIGAVAGSFFKENDAEM